MNHTTPFATTLPQFDTLVALHENDPEAYEILRLQLLRSCIESAPTAHQQALEELFDEINVIRNEATSPLEAAVNASRLMVDSCVRLRAAMGELLDANAALQTAVLLDKFRL